VRIDIVGRDTWRDLSEEWRALLPFQDPAVHVQVYGGYQHALIEATQGIAKLFSHKKSIAIIEPAEPAIAALGVAFSEETYKVHRWNFDASDAVINAADFSTNLADTLFVLSSEDDPVTGRLYDPTKLNAAVKDQRLFRIRVSHSAHRAPQEISRPAPFEVRILSLAPNLALLIAGERFRVRPVIAPHLSWNLSSALSRDGFASVSSLKYEENKKRILHLESHLPEGYRRYFTPEADRIFDRAVFVAENFDGSAVVEALVDQLSLRMEPAGHENLADSTSPCRWNHPRFTQWLLDRGESEETVRGMVVLDPSLIDGDTVNRLKVARKV
jgi:hypothetical protein